MEKAFETLLEKFYRGETDRDEEQLLADFFSRERLPEQFEADRNLFHSLAAATPEMSEGLEQRMSELIDSLEHAEQSGKPLRAVKLQQNESLQGKRVVTRRYFRLQIAGLVASLLIVAGIGIWTYFGGDSKESLLADTFDNPAEAQEATLEALQLFADNFSKGTHTVEQVDQQVGETFGIVREVLGQEVNRIEQ